MFRSILKLLWFLAIFIFITKTSFAEFNIKMSDSISPFFSAWEEIKTYSNIPFYQLDKYNDSLVDLQRLEKAKKNFINYIKIIKENWYNSISLDDLNHLLIFEKSWIYKNSKIEKRNQIYLKYYQELVNIAKNDGINVYITTDMQFYTDLMEEKIWDIEISNKKLKEVNKEAFEEIFTNIPSISWIILRVWEWWSAYNSWKYKSKIIYKTPESVNTLLKDLLPIFEKYDKNLIFRTWTIWIWDIWNLITNKNTYDKVFEGITSKNLIVSIKHTPWDFFYFDDLNPTIWHGNLKQIVEIQIRREYEWWWDFPNYMWEYYKQIYYEINNKKNVIWVWNWNQTWWWWWGENILFNFWFNFWNEINFYSVWQILKTWKIDINKVLEKYDFTKEEKEIIKNILFKSREIVKKWFYINDYRKKEIYIWWVRIPSLNRIWWDRVSSSPIILSLIYNSLDTKLETIEESSYVLWIQEKELNDWKKIARNNELNNKITNTLENRYKIFDILHTFKKAIIIYFQTWRKDYYDVLDEKIKDYKEFKNNKDYINFNFDEIYKFYSGKDNSFFLYLNIFSFFVLIFTSIKHKYIKNIIQKKDKKHYLILIWILINIFILLFTPYLFLSEYNFYWILVKINYLSLLLFFVYFIVIVEIINRVYRLKLKVKKDIWKIIYSIFPILIISEIIIVISTIMWEQFFWNFIALGIIKEWVRILLILAFLIYFLAFLWFWFKFSNISRYVEKLKRKKSIYVFSFIFLIIYLFFIYSIDTTKIFIVGITEKILPSYFETAWSDVSEFFTK